MVLLMSIKLSGYILKRVGEESFTLKEKEMSAVLYFKTAVGLRWPGGYSSECETLC